MLDIFSKKVSISSERGSIHYIEYVIIFSVCLEAINDGIQFGWPSPSFQKFKNDGNSLRMNDAQELWIILMSPIGLTGICLINPILMENFGRKTLILMMSFGQVICLILIGFFQNIKAFYVGRFFAGISSGISFAIVPTYLCEVVSPEIRGTAISFATTCCAFGSLLINIIGSYFSVSTTAKLCCLGPVMYFLLVLWIPESPYYLIQKGKYVKAKHVIEWLRRSSDTHEEYERITQAVNIEVKFEDFFSMNNKRALLIAGVSRLIQQMIGFSAITFYLQDILQKTGFYVAPSITSSIYLIIQVIFSSISLKFLDKFGRRPPVIASLSCITIALLTIATYFYAITKIQLETSIFSYIPLIGLFAFIAAYSIGIQQLPGLLVGELFSPQFKGLASGICTIALGTGNLASCVLYYFLEIYGIFFSFLAFTIFAIAGLIFIIFYLPETNGKTLENIQTDLNNM